MTSIDNMAAEIMKGLTEYADLANESMKKAVKKTATSVKKEISSNAPKDTGAYAKSWAVKKTKENSHSLEMTVHSENSSKKATPSVAADVWQENHIYPPQKKAVCSCLKN